MPTTTTATPTYRVELTVNGERLTAAGKDLEAALLKLEPEFVHTEMFVRVLAGKKAAERILHLHDARKLFKNEAFRSIILDNLLLPLS